MQGINKAILVGNVGRDPETRYLDGGIAVTNFSLATNETYKNKKGEKVTLSEWHNIVLWRGLAEIAEKYVRKGMPLYIEGRMKTRSWEKDGQRKYVTEVVGDNLIILGKRTAKEEDVADENKDENIDSSLDDILNEPENKDENKEIKDTDIPY